MQFFKIIAYMKVIALIIFISTFAIKVSAQTDTTLKEFYPLGIGDTWQHRNQYGEISSYQKVVSEDTLLPNGYRYAKIGVPPNFNTGFAYRRVDSLLRVQWAYPCDTCTQIIDSCGGTAPTEISLYRLGESLGNSWQDCVNWNGFLGPPLIKYDGMRTSYVFGQQREIMVFKFGYFDPSINDTIFPVEDLLVRGIGLYKRSFWWSGGYNILTGAIINGIQYGTIVSSEHVTKTNPKYSLLHQNYPNPFNLSTIIQYDISQTTNAKLKIFNLIGEEVAVLVNEIKTPGEYKVEFNAKSLSSGIYIAVLKTNEAQLSKAMLLIK
jgi:hypothetical protein